MWEGLNLLLPALKTEKGDHETLEAGKGKEMDSPLQSPEGHTALLIPWS